MERITPKLAQTPIAIIGMAGVFPEARNLGEFWENVLAGKDCTSDVPETHWRSEVFYDPDPLAPDKTHCRRGGFLPAETFDPIEFGITPRSLDATGLVQLLSLNVARDVLRDAGCVDASWFDPARAGVILGVCGQNSSLGPLVARLQAPVIEEVAASCGLAPQDVAEISRRYLASYPQWTPESFPGLLGNVVSGRIAKHFNLGGANYTVDAACASSLAALRAAVDELVLGRADLMITGGCDVDNSVFAFMCFSKTPALSGSGRIRPFDAAADGTLIGEGIGMLALKRLADAERDGDRVYAVVRGIGNSSDGPATSVYAPCGEGQRLALERAYRDADVPATSIALIEAHGTGTPTGDGVELAALNRLLGEARPRSVAIGSVKSQIGHTKAAAGAAGLIKTAMALHDKILPPHINVDEPHEAAARADAAVYVNGTARPWIREPNRPLRRGGVSSFGFGGVNFHVVLEEHDDPADTRSSHRLPFACLWHAPDPAALLDRLSSGAPARPEAPIPPGHARIGFVAADESDYDTKLAAALAALRERVESGEWDLDGVHYRRGALDDGARAAALFSGQGSQYPDMGLHAVNAFPPVRAAFDEVSLLCPESLPLSETVFPPSGTAREAASERLRRTACAQPAIGALSMGQYRYLAELGFEPDSCLGHSFGELTAFWAAGGLDDEGFLRLAVARGAAMAAPAGPPSADPGAMAAVRCPEDRLAPILAAHPEVIVCNRNAPDELVVGGPTETVETLVEACRGQGLFAKRLPVSGAFHTSLVAHATEAFAEAAHTVPFHAPVRPVLAGDRETAYGEDAAANRSALAAQITRPVDFRQRVEELYDSGHRVFVEFGPGRVLSGLVERILDGREATVVPTDLGPDHDSAAALKEAAVRLAVLGFPLLDLDRYDPPPSMPVIPSQAAQSLRGPGFAVDRVRDDSYRELLATEHRLASDRAADDRRRTDEANTPQAAPEPVVARLSQIAAEHLELHTRYIDGQLRTARELLDLTADRRPTQAVTREIEAICEHGVALGRAHARANEAFAELARLERRPAAEASPLPVRPPVPPEEPVVEQRHDTLASPAPAPSEEQPPEAPSAPVPDPPVDMARLIRQVIADKTGFPLDMIDLDQDVQSDLGIDSLAQVEIAAELWRHFPSAPRESMYRLATGRTVRDFVALTEQVIAEADTGASAEAVRELPLGRAHVALRELHEVDLRLDAFRPGPAALVVDDGGGTAAATIAALERAGWRTSVLALPDVKRVHSAPSRLLEDWSEPALAEALAELLPDDGALDLAVVALTETASTPEAIRRLSHTLLLAKRLQPALETGAAEGGRAALVTVTALDGALGYAGSQGRTAHSFLGGVGALLRTVALETDGVFCRALDYAPDLAAEQVAERLLMEIADAAGDPSEVGHDGTVRRTAVLTEKPTLLPVPTAGAATAEIAENDLFVVTGGARGVTSWCVIEMARRYRCRFLLLGRTPISEGPDASAEQREVGLTLETLRALGVNAEYLAVDVTDAAAVAAALAPHAHDVTGVLHGSGVLADQWLKDKTAEAVERVLGTKLTGLDAVLGALDPERLRHLVLFTSVAALNGNLRQSDYAMANDALDRFACAWKAGRPRCRVAAVAFGPWHGGMAGEAIQEIFRQQGVPMLTRERGTAMFVEQLDAAHRDHVVTLLGPTAPLFHKAEPLAATGVTVRRDLSGLAAHPVLRDHAFDGKTPVMPFSVAIGWCVDHLERMSGGRPVVEARDVMIAHGLVFDGPEQDRFELTATPAGDGTDWTHVAIHSHRDGEPAALRYRGSFRTAAEPGAAPRLEGLEALEPRPFEPHPYYAEGFLFHGPALAGLGPELDAGPDRVVAMARLAEPSLPGFDGRLYHGALSDLLPQAATLLERRLTGRRCLPLKVDAVEMFAALPDDEPFLIVSELEEQRALDTRYTVSACDPDGRVLLRWRGLTMLTVHSEMLGDSKWSRLHALVEQGRPLGAVNHG